MRIVAGSARGRRLRVPRGRSVRPTADRVKESIFSMLESRYGCEGIAVLDLFAGSGNLGIEALSRGAAAAVFVENDARAVAAIRANLETAGFAGEVFLMPAARAIATLHARGRRFGGVFLDPPYDRGLVGPTLAALAGAALVEDDGWIVVEHGRDEEPAARVGTLARTDTRRYGDTRVTTFAVQPAEEDVDVVS
jgi:16S rRNA (guanine(966)-N(2))-methyltransferase RsmD